MCTAYFRTTGRFCRTAGCTSALTVSVFVVLRGASAVSRHFLPQDRFGRTPIAEVISISVGNLDENDRIASCHTASEVTAA